MSDPQYDPKGLARCAAGYGATDEEIREVILQTVVYGGIARGMWALAEFEKWKKEDLMGFGDPRVGSGSESSSVD